MYKCYDCGAIFDEPKRWVEIHGEPMCGCPYCGGGLDYEYCEEEDDDEEETDDEA